MRLILSFGENAFQIETPDCLVHDGVTVARDDGSLYMVFLQVLPHLRPTIVYTAFCDMRQILLLVLCPFFGIAPVTLLDVCVLLHHLGVEQRAIIVEKYCFVFLLHML